MGFVRKRCAINLVMSISLTHVSNFVYLPRIIRAAPALSHCRPTRQSDLYIDSKGKGHPMTYTGTEGRQGYSSSPFATRHLKEVGGQHHVPAALPPGRIRSQLYGRLGGPRGREGRHGKTRPPPGFDSRTVKPVASRSTHYAIPAAICWLYRFKKIMTVG